MSGIGIEENHSAPRELEGREVSGDSKKTVIEIAWRVYGLKSVSYIHHANLAMKARLIFLIHPAVAPKCNRALEAGSIQCLKLMLIYHTAK